MNNSERRLMDTLVQTGRIKPETMQKCLRRKADGEGLIDSLVRQGEIDTKELEQVLGELKPGKDPAPHSVPAAEIVQSLDRYVVLYELGRGGMGSVFHAYDSKLKRSVALKVMKTADPEDEERFRREVEIAAGLQHPQIAAIFDHHSAGEWFIIAMQYVEGQSLDKVRLEPADAVKAIAQAARAVHFAHQRGIIHRDLKPENLIRTQDGRTFVLDFGIARPLDTKGRLTQTGSILGTPMYMSPEQAEGRVLDARTDVYSLGGALYYLVTGRTPHKPGPILQLIRKVCLEDPLAPRKVDPQIPRDVETMIIKAMQKEPDQRYASAFDFADDLDRYVAGKTILARPVSAPMHAFQYLRRRPWAMATVATVLLGLTIAFLLVRREGVQQNRLVEATARVEEAARKIDEWDRLLYLPPRDLTPHEALLRDASTYCEEAAQLSKAGIPEADYQRARALVRMDDYFRAEELIGDAIRIKPDGRYYLERARIRLGRLMSWILEMPQNLSLIGGAFLPTWIDKSSQRKEFRRAGELVLADLQEARQRGHTTEFEQSVINTIEAALRDDFDQAKKQGGENLAKLPPWEQAEFHRVLGWVFYLKSFLHPARKDAKSDPSLEEAAAHIEAAMDMRRSDPALYRFRASIALDEARRTPDETQRKDLLASAKARIDTALQLRPNDPDSWVLTSQFHLSSGPTIGKRDLEFNFLTGFSVSTLSKMVSSVPKGALAPAEQACRKAIALNSNHARAWVMLSQIRLLQLVVGAVKADLRDLRSVLDALTRILGADPDPILSSTLRSYRMVIANMAYLAGGKKDEDLGQRAREDLDQLQRADPNHAVEMEETLRQMEELFRKQSR